jgi:hypothetical protein
MRIFRKLPFFLKLAQLMLEASSRLTTSTFMFTNHPLFTDILAGHEHLCHPTNQKMAKNRKIAENMTFGPTSLYLHSTGAPTLPHLYGLAHTSVLNIPARS